jgi:hypothetical protein
MTPSNRALLSLALLPNIGWVGFIAGLGVWRALRGESPMAESSGPILIGVGVFLAIACPFLANYLRPRPAPAA